MKRVERAGAWIMNVGEGANPRRQQPDERRAWEDCIRYGFLAMGGGPDWIERAKQIELGDEIFAYLNKHGYVGFGTVCASPRPFKDFVPAGERSNLLDLPLVAKVQRERMKDPENWDMCVGVQWLVALPRASAVCKHLYRLRALEECPVGPRRTELREVFNRLKH